MKEHRRGEGQAPDPERIARAAVLCWDDRQTDEKIARSLGVSRRTLARWKHRPEFVSAITAAQLQWRVDHEGRSALRLGGR